MRLQKEQIVVVHPLLDKLLHDYFKRTDAKNGVPPLVMNWPLYVELARQGHLVVFTARAPVNKLVGVAMYHVHSHPHHMGHMCAACDILAVDVDQRGKGIGRALVEYAETALRELDVRVMLHMFRTQYDVDPLFPKLGYKLHEQVYMKEIG